MPQWTINDYTIFVIQLLIAFGLAFQTPDAENTRQHQRENHQRDGRQRSATITGNTWHVRQDQGVQLRSPHRLVQTDPVVGNLQGQLGGKTVTSLERGRACVPVTASHRLRDGQVALGDRLFESAIVVVSPRRVAALDASGWAGRAWSLDSDDPHAGFVGLHLCRKSTTEYFVVGVAARTSVVQ